MYDSSEKIAKATHCGDNESNAQNENDDCIIESNETMMITSSHRLRRVITRRKQRDDKIIAIKLCPVIKIYSKPEIFYGGSKGGGPPLLVVVTNSIAISRPEIIFGGLGGRTPLP